MKRKILVFILLLMFLLMPANAYGSVVFTIGSTRYIVDGQERGMDVAPYIKDDRTFLPVRFAASAAGVTDDNIIWNSTEHSVILIKGNSVVKLVIGSKTMLIDGTPITMDVVPEIVDPGRTMLPIRWVGQALGCTISWDAAAETITIGAAPRSQETSVPLTPSLWIPGPRVVSPIEYDASVQTVSKNVEWEYKGIAYNWHVEVPANLIGWDREVCQYVTDYFNSNAYDQAAMLRTMPDNIKPLVLAISTRANGNLVPWVTEESNYRWAGYLAESLAARSQQDGHDYFHTAEFVLSFVGGALSYQEETYTQLPAQTFIDNGDCDGKAVLLVAILKNMGYNVALLGYSSTDSKPGHMAVGVAFDNTQVPRDRNLFYYEHNGLKYYFAETTTSGWQMGEASVTIPAYVYVVN